MNQNEIKEKLLSIEDAPIDFSVVLTGKRSKKVNGLYKPDLREIIIHNKNFTAGKRADGSAGKGDNLLIYTAIHEYAHHLHACARGGHLSPRAHTAEFWAILHGLLEKAQAKGIYEDVFTGSKELDELTRNIRERCLTENGSIVKELGEFLLKAQDICTAIGGRYEDYIDRILRIPRQAANLAIRMFQYNLNPETGADNMRFLAGIANEDKRQAAETALLNGKSPDSVKIALRKGSSPGEDDDESQDGLRERLEKEKLRLERTIVSLTKRLEQIERELSGSA